MNAHDKHKDQKALEETKARAPLSGAGRFGLNRREVFAAAGGVAGLFLLGAAAKLQASGPVVRPPGGQDEEAFLGLCIRCDRCRSVCPTSAVGVGTIAQGLRAMRTPVMNFAAGDCDFCGKCAEVCPTGALKPFDKATAKIGTAELTDICIAIRTGGCTKCFEECPYDAIDLSETNEPLINSARCNGCGRCVFVCPANVFQSFKGETARGIAVRTDKDTVRTDPTVRDTTPNVAPERSRRHQTTSAREASK